MMHLTIANEQNNEDNENSAVNSEGLFVQSIRILERLIREVRERIKRNPRRYHLPIMKSYKAEIVANDIISLNVSMAKYGTYRFSISLPVFMSLEPKSVQKDKIDNYAESQKIRDNLDKIITYEPFELSANEEFIARLMYNKYVLTMGILIAGATLFSLFAPIAAFKILPATIQLAGIASKLVVLSVLTIYFFPVAGYLYSKNYYVHVLEKRIAEIERDLDNNNEALVKSKLETLSLEAFPMFFLEYNFPKNRILQHKYLYLKGVVERSSYALIKSLHFTTTDEDRLKVLRAIINDIERSMHQEIRRIWKLPGGDEEARCQREVLRAKRLRPAYLWQLPTNIQAFHEYGSKIRSQLQECVSSLRDKDFKLAMAQFRAIKLDGFSKYAYPDVAILYYQLDSIAALFDPERKSILGYDLDLLRRLEIVSKNVEFIKNVIEKYYPERASTYNEYADAYLKTIQELINLKEPFEVLPDLYTPLALKALYQAEQNAKEDLKQIRKPRSPSCPDIYTGCGEEDPSLDELKPKIMRRCSF